MGEVLQFTGGKKCRDCGCQIEPRAMREAPHRLYCETCHDTKAKVNANFAKSMRLSMDDIARIMGYRTPQ